jgi:hypothetical protein
MKNITELRDELAAVFTGLKNGTLEPKQAIEMNNAAGKIIHTVKAQMEYAEMRNETPDIPFMRTETKDD